MNANNADNNQNGCLASSSFVFKILMKTQLFTLFDLKGKLLMIFSGFHETKRLIKKSFKLWNEVSK